MRIKRIIRIVCCLLLVLSILAGIELLYSNYSLSVSEYKVFSDKITTPVRVVFLSDLHGRTFGKGNCRLLKKIGSNNPDMIALVGDIFNNDADEDEIASMSYFIQQCTEIAPTYFSMGNHENSYLKHDAAGLKERINESGAVLLDDEYCDLEICGNHIRIGGYMGFYPYPHMMTKDKAKIQAERDFFGAYKSTDRYKIFLNHIPTGWLDWEFIDNDSIDLVLSGHYHGGVIRIPILEQGLYAPYVGKLPPYTKGMFVGKKATCILTTGLAGSYGLPRVFNPPEVCVVDILPAA